MAARWLTLPNAISIGRIAACPVIFVLVLVPTLAARIAAFVVFVAAALSDLWDGYLARKHGWVTDTGKLLDPAADKLLLVATFVPFYLLSRRAGAVGSIPWWGELPLWVLVVIFGREVIVTVFRVYAARRGVVISAAKAGKYKAFTQNLFSGALLLWYVLETVALRSGWSGLPWSIWSGFHGAVVGVSLGAAVFLTVYSLGDYAWKYRTLAPGGG